MPTNRRRRRIDRRTNIETLTFGQAYHLCNGLIMLPDSGYSTRGELVAAWRLHGKTILEAWFDRCWFGTRPFGWWVAVAIPRHGERLVIDTSDDGIKWAEGARRNDHGAAVGKFGILHTHLIPRLQEDELTYLIRHKLLLRGERERIGDDDPFAEPDALHPTLFHRPTLWDSHLKEIYGDENDE